MAYRANRPRDFPEEPEFSAGTKRDLLSQYETSTLEKGQNLHTPDGSLQGPLADSTSQ